MEDGRAQCADQSQCPSTSQSSRHKATALHGEETLHQRASGSQAAQCMQLSLPGAPHVHWLCADPRKFALSWKVEEEEEREQQEADAV